MVIFLFYSPGFSKVYKYTMKESFISIVAPSTYYSIWFMDDFDVSGVIWVLDFVFLSDNYGGSFSDFYGGMNG